MAKKHHGGKRKGAGRPTQDDPKKQLSLYVRESIIEHVGGEKRAKEIAIKAIESAPRFFKQT